MNLDYSHYYRRGHPETPEHQAKLNAFSQHVLGPQQGRTVPLSLNLLGTARKP